MTEALIGTCILANYDSDICLGMFRVSDCITMNIQQRKN